MHSQNNEESHILDYFKGFTGILLDVGANDGVTLSNSRALIELGWCGMMIEPSPTAYNRLYSLYRDNQRVIVYPYAVSDYKGVTILYESGPHLSGNDTGLLSSLIEKPFQKVTVKTDTIYGLFGNQSFDFITIDCEGMDLVVLKQIDLSMTKLICVEHNSVKSVKSEIIKYCAKFGLNDILCDNKENILIGR